MKARDIAVVLGVAGLTTGILVSVCRPLEVSARSPLRISRAPATQPALKADDMVFKLEAAKKEYKAGDKPTVNVIASNGAAEQRNVTLTLRMMCVAPSSPMMRMLPMPKEIWSSKCTISAKAGEKKSTAIAVDKPLPAGQRVYITMSTGEEKSAAGRLGVSYLTLLSPKAPAHRLSTLPRPAISQVRNTSARGN